MQGEIQGTPVQVSSHARIASLAVQNVLRGVKHGSTAFCVVRWKPPHAFIHSRRTHAMRARTHPRSKTQSGTHTTRAPAPLRPRVRPLSPFPHRSLVAYAIAPPRSLAS